MPEMSPIMRGSLDAATRRLAGHFRGVFSEETVARYVDDSFTQTASQSTVGPNCLPVIIEDIADPADQPIEVVRQIRSDIRHHVGELLETLTHALAPETRPPLKLETTLTRIAVITDIHGNLPALEASLDAIDQIGVDRIYCGGDLVGYGPDPNEVCALIEDREIPTIYGNYDYAIGRELHDCGCAYVTQHDRELGQQSVAWTLAHTDERAKAYMRGLPFDLRFELGDVPIHLVHGSPRKVNEYLFEDKPASLYERLAAAEDAKVMVFGHTHKPWIHSYGGVLFVNCGSVGKPKDGDPRCAFAILELDQAGEVQVAIERVPYDAEAVARAVEEAGLPSEYAKKLVAAA